MSGKPKYNRAYLNRLPLKALGKYILELEREALTFHAVLEESSAKMEELDAIGTKEAKRESGMLALAYCVALKKRDEACAQGRLADEVYQHKAEALRRIRQQDSAWFREAKSFAGRLTESLADRRSHPLLKGV